MIGGRSGPELAGAGPSVTVAHTCEIRFRRAGRRYPYSSVRMVAPIRRTQSGSAMASISTIVAVGDE